MGLLLGIEFDADPRHFMDRMARGLLNRVSEQLSTYWIVSRLLNEFRMLTAGPLVGPRVIRLMPPLCLNKDEVDQFVNALDSICSDFIGYSGLLKQAGISIGKRLAYGRATAQ
jgi:acetylornithine/succinyldiaminopimelate/putrescine aminotransferase